MRLEKQSIIKEYADKIGDSSYCLLVDYRGLSMEQMSGLRTVLRQKASRIQVVKNSFLKRATEEQGKGEVNTFVDGPIAMITGQGDVTEVAKTLKAFMKDNELPVVRGGFMDSSILDPEEVRELADMPGRQVLLGIMVGTVAAPMTGLVGVMNQKVLSLLYALRAVEEKKSK